jgi:hypothetical protein
MKEIHVVLIVLYLAHIVAFWVLLAIAVFKE